MHAIGHKDRVLWIANLILNIYYFVGVNQVHYFPYVFYTCLAGNCIVDKNCLFSLVRRKTEQLRSRWTCTQFKLVYFEERRTTPLSHHRFFFKLPLFFSIFLGNHVHHVHHHALMSFKIYTSIHTAFTNRRMKNRPSRLSARFL